MNKQVARVFRVDKPIVAMIHLYGFMPERVRGLAKWEIQQLYASGVDAVLVEDYYGTVEDVEWTLDYLRREYSDRVYGVNLLRDPEKGLKLASRYGASFVQIDSVCGRLPQDAGRGGKAKTTLNDAENDAEFAARLATLRAEYPVFLLGGVRFKYQPILSGRSVEEDVRLGKERCDAVVVTGAGTGLFTDMEKIRQFRDALADYPLFVGAGMTLETCEERLAVADGAIVGSWFKERGETSAPVDPRRVAIFMELVKKLREEQR